MPASRIRPTDPAAIHPRWATQEETAQYAKISEKTLRRYLASGRLTGYRIGDRLLRIDLNEVDAIMRPIRPDQVV